MQYLIYLTILVDTGAPTILGCPGDINTSTELGSLGKTVFWDEPTAFDESGNVELLYKSHKGGDTFSRGSTLVTYMFTDSTGNLAVCTFEVTVTSGMGIP